MSSSHPVRPEEPSPPDSVSRAGSAGVWTPQGGSFLGHDSTETPWSAVSILELILVRVSPHALKLPVETTRLLPHLSSSCFLSSPPLLFSSCFLFSSPLVSSPLLLSSSPPLVLSSPPPPGSGLVDCLSQRRLALSLLFSGPVDPPFRASSVRLPASCVSLLRPLRDLLSVEAEPTSFLSHLVEVVHGLFPSVGGALQALAHSAPRRLQENLFGGKFLKNAASFNFSRVVGTQGALGLDRLSSQSASLQKNRVLVQSVSRALEDPAFLSALQNTLRGLSSSHSLDQVNRKYTSNWKDFKINLSFSMDDPNCQNQT